MGDLKLTLFVYFIIGLLLWCGIQGWSLYERRITQEIERATLRY